VLKRSLEQILLVPREGRTADRGLLVFLHGRSDDLDAPRGMWSDALARGLERLGPAAPAVLLLNGGQSSYLHDRADGPWGRYVLREAIPDAVRRARTKPGRLAIGGISMGGFGALDLAASSAGRFCAVGGHSPAIFASGAVSAPGAFDDADDFARHDVLARARQKDPYAGTPLWLDVGDEDPFRATTEQLAADLRRKVRVWPGEHDGECWHSHMDAYLRFYARALAACR